MIELFSTEECPICKIHCTHSNGVHSNDKDDLESQQTHYLYTCDVCKVQFCTHWDNFETTELHHNGSKEQLDQNDDFNKFCSSKCKRIYKLIPGAN